MATREERAVNLTIISATDLKKVGHFGKQTSYVVAYIYSNHKETTRVDKDGGVNPTWNSRLSLQADEDQLQQGRLYVTLEIYSHGTISDKIVGTARIPLSEVSKGPDGSHSIGLEVHRPSGRTKGTLNVSIALAEKRTVPVYQNRMPAAYGAGACIWYSSTGIRPRLSSTRVLSSSARVLSSTGVSSAAGVLRPTRQKWYGGSRGLWWRRLGSGRWAPWRFVGRRYVGRWLWRWRRLWWWRWRLWRKLSSAFLNSSLTDLRYCTYAFDLWQFCREVYQNLFIPLRSEKIVCRLHHRIHVSI